MNGVVKRYNMTLLEVLMALGLTALLITSLFTVNLFTNKIYSESNALCQESRDLHRVYLRLYNIFDNIRCRKELNLDNKEKNYFYTEKADELVFTYDNGGDRILPGKVIARLYVDENDNLCLETRSLPNDDIDDEHCKNEMLLDDVDGLAFEFFHPNNDDNDDIWDKTNDYLPLIIWVKVYRNVDEEPFLLSFELKKSVQNNFSYPVVRL